MWWLLACFGNNNPNPVNDAVDTDEADADADADSDADTDVVDVNDSGIMEVYWEGSFTETFVGTHSIVAWYQKYENDLDSSTDPEFCKYSWDTIGGSVLTNCENCDFAFTVEHSAGEPSDPTNCKNTLQLGSFGEVLADRQLGFATTHIEAEQQYTNVLLEYHTAYGDIPAGWYYLAPVEFVPEGFVYKQSLGYYYY